MNETAYDRALIEEALKTARTRTEKAMTRFFDARRETGMNVLYDQISDYPFRVGKGLRPALVYAACQGMGGTEAQAENTATAIELFHNGALVHDDIEDISDFRRGDETLFRRHGVPIAINTGDATFVFCLSLLLDNVDQLGVRKAMRILKDFERLSRESVEGQAIELDWIHNAQFDLETEDYLRMAYKKTCWYTMIAPLRLGVVAGSGPAMVADLEEALIDVMELGYLAGIGFQVQDDLLNLTADEVLYGKEISGDLYEGKRTVMLLHFLRTAPKRQRARAIRLLTLPRADKEPDEVRWLLQAMHEQGSIQHGRELAQDFINRALKFEAEGLAFMPETRHRQFLREVLKYVIARLK
ncbi:polyprenyl synthetase family protein [uncultured Roseobacter sp.]|uniref:polyprenyl synthetase family protein n=1 Tax=uncultured Roseobacter sp. TaxID=114847 RepID=UPI00262841F1|nr:polyprenyl synthetase family protein [uncultured Roseobacter sp.]